jgi:hypothetical protein
MKSRDYLAKVRAVIPEPEKKKYVKEPPYMHTYDKQVYYYEKTIKPNMHMYKSKLGFRICFDNFELLIKE